jgi:ankyrin repeat protein
MLSVQGVSVNERSGTGATALYAAAWRDNAYKAGHFATETIEDHYAKCIDVLLEKGADPQLKETSMGNYALGIASYQGKCTRVEHLLRAENLDVNQKNNDGENPLHLGSH